MTQGIKDNIIFGSAIFMLIFGAALTTAGFIIDPAGQVHDSVLYVLGQCLLFAGSAMGISAYTTGKVREMRHEINRRLNDIEDRRREDEGDNHPTHRHHTADDYEGWETNRRHRAPSEDEPINEQEDGTETD